MEIIIILAFLLLVSIVIYMIWKNHCLKRDIYDLMKKLDYSLNELSNGKTLKHVTLQQDDLWGMIYEKLCRVSDMYTKKNKEIYAEKESLKELVSDISHQTKTPLANIKLYLEILTDEGSLSGNTEPLRKIEKQVDKLDFLLQSMIKMSRLETGTIKIQKTETLLADTLAKDISAVLLKAQIKNMQNNIEKKKKMSLNHDGKWTGEAIFNILDNAVKYTPSDGNIHISVEKGEIFTKISICDTGKGIPLERQGTIFTRFYREPEVHDMEGVGIGLYLARKIISMQNGYIEVNSQVGVGSTFSIFLPN